jgi:hypothetical protein
MVCMTNVRFALICGVILNTLNKRNSATPALQLEASVRLVQRLERLLGLQTTGWITTGFRHGMNQFLHIIICCDAPNVFSCNSA